MSTRKFFAIAIALCAVIAGGLSFYASSSPDGLEKVAAEQGLDANVKDSAVANSPLADYGLTFLGSERLSGAAAGLIGLAIVGLLGYGLYIWVRKPVNTK